MRFIRYTTLIVWLGGLIFFGAVLAPIAFSVLPERHLAGMVVNHALTRLHFIGLACGIIFVAASLIRNQLLHGELRICNLTHLAILLMMGLTALSQFGVMPRMEALRQDMGVIDRVSSDDPRRLEFDRLHQRSTQLEGTVLLLGVIVVWGISREEA